MSKELIVSSAPDESIAAIVEDGEVVEIFIEREKSRSMVGNIYKGRVQRVLPGMQAAFVEIGLERDGFLYVADVHEEMEEFENVVEEGEQRQQPQQHHGQQSIEDMLQPGRDVIVQVAKAPMEAKGARLTTHITLAGRFLVYMPTIDRTGVSRKIDSSEERGRLRSILRRHKEIAPGGFIVRTAAEGKSEEEVVADIKFLANTWNQIRSRAEKATPPTCIHRELALPEKLMRDVAGFDVAAIRIDDEEQYLKCVEFLEQFNPPLAARVRLHTRESDILEDYGVTQEIERSLQSKVWLKSGGYIVINQTEALVAIDVNTGKFVGKKNFEETIYQTNVEATREVARQIRLRNLGGILVLDLIDMEDRKNRARVMKSLEAELRKDRHPNVILPINDFGLALITRKRVQSSLERSLCDLCPQCSGSGRVKSIETIVLNAARELRRLRIAMKDGEIVVRVHPDVAQSLKAEARSLVRMMDRAAGRAVSIRAEATMSRNQFALATMVPQS